MIVHTDDMEASSAHLPLTRNRISLTGPLLRLRSDEQLVALFRAGSEDAFATIHDRYKQRLFAYCRQMLSSSRQDAEDVLQDVFVRAYQALRNDERELNLRAWLYRVAHNRCIDQLRRPAPAERDIFEVSRRPLHDPIVEAQRRDDLRKLVQDVGNLPEQQRSALLMREIDGMSYQDLAAALSVTVPAVKSLLVRARVGLAEAAEARDMDCSLIREDLASACDRGVRASGRARRHLRECSGCREYKIALRTTKAQFAALAGPAVGLAPLALLAKLGIGGGSGAGAGAGAASAGGGVAAVAGASAAGKVAAVVAGVAIATGGAVEVKHQVDKARAKPDRPAAAASSGGERRSSSPTAPSVAAAAAAAPVARTGPRDENPAAAAAAARRDRRDAAKRKRAEASASGPATTDSTPAETDTGTAPGTVTGTAPADPTTAAPGTDTAPSTSSPVRGGEAQGSTGSGSTGSTGSGATPAEPAPAEPVPADPGTTPPGNGPPPGEGPPPATP